MNFYDVYTTLSVNPSTQKPLQEVCEFLKSPNSLEPLKKELWKWPARSESPGMYPFDEETGRIYDALWKAAQAENYSALTRFGRWLMKTICPPADDEGMAAYHRRAKMNSPVETEEDHYQPEPVQVQDVNPPEVNEAWDISDDEHEEVVVAPKKTPPREEVTKRSKKGD